MEGNSVTLDVEKSGLMEMVITQPLGVKSVRLYYDLSNYVDFQMLSDGGLSITNIVGSNPRIIYEGVEIKPKK